MTAVTANAKVVTDNSGALEQIPVVITDQGVLQPLVHYFLEHRHDRSLSWMTRVAQGVTLLLEYMDVNREQAQDPVKLFKNFGARLNSGTIGIDGLDPSGLYWRPKQAANARALLGCLTDLSDYLVRTHGAKPLNPGAPSTRYDEMLAGAAYEHSRSRAFLGHIRKASPGPDALSNRSAGSARTPMVTATEPTAAFPERLFNHLLFTGFSRNGELLLREVLITLLLHGAGFRKSEPFHLFVHDVVDDPRNPELAQVRIYHPEMGLAPADLLDAHGRPLRSTRTEYLATKHGLSPRSKVTGKFHAGWKAPMLDSKHFYMQAHWFPEVYGVVFNRLWKLYLRQIASVDRGHPYAFVSTYRNTAGEPYTLDNYSAAHATAVRKLGLTPTQLEGLIPHGHRHAYGRRLMLSGLSAPVIQKAMHHKSIESQLVYTQPTISETSLIMADAELRLEQRYKSGQAVAPQLSDLLKYGFEDIDPNGLFSGPSPKLRG